MAGTFIVIGSREWKSTTLIWQALQVHTPSLVVHGGYHAGVDHIVERWCHRMGVDSHVIRNKSKGRARQQHRARMLQAYPGAHVLAFPIEAGSTNEEEAEAQRIGLTQAHHLGHPITIYGPNGSPIDFLLTQRKEKHVEIEASR